MRVNRKLSRRDFLKATGAMGASGILAAHMPKAVQPFNILRETVTVRVVYHTYKPLNDLHEQQFAAFMEEASNQLLATVAGQERKSDG